MRRFLPAPPTPPRLSSPLGMRCLRRCAWRRLPLGGWHPPTKTRRDEPGVPDGPWIRVPHAHAARLVQEELVLPATMEYSLLDRGHTSVRVKRCHKHFGTPKWGAVHIVSPTPRASLPSVTIPTRATISHDSWPDTSLGWDRMGLANHRELWGIGGGTARNRAREVGKLRGIRREWVETGSDVRITPHKHHSKPSALVTLEGGKANGRIQRGGGTQAA